nr:hypothetical protein [Deltaproteobacteria bacterium]
NFMPTTGTISKLRLPSGPGTRVDTHLFPGCIVTPFYDPLLVKLIAHHTTRNAALRRMGRMLDETVVEGLTTNKDLLYKLLNHERFLSGNGDTSLVTQLMSK